MGSIAGVNEEEMATMVKGERRRKPKFLCLHGFRTSADIMRKQVVGKWPESVTARLDLVFADAPFPAEGKSDVEGIFPPPYYEWFQFDKESQEYRNFDECLKYIEGLMIEQGPFDGLMGFSRGATLSAALPGLQAKGLALTRVPKIKFVIIIGGSKLASPVLAEHAYSAKIGCPSLHLLGEMDILRRNGEKLLESFVAPLVIRQGSHCTQASLFLLPDERSMETMLAFLERIEKEVGSEALSEESKD